MIITENVSRIWGLAKTLNNPFFFLYRIFHYLNRFVPYRLASYIYRKNLNDYTREGTHDFLIETYDGSGQAVHPDIAFYKKQYWLTVTPYPYGMEEYENPCIYQGQNLNALKSPDGPVAVQHKHTQGVHLSDPCFAVKDKTLFCFYRESERKGGIEKQAIWGVQYSDSENKWRDPVLLFDSVDDKILSPAMLYNVAGELVVYYVSSLHNTYTLVSTKIGKSIEPLIKYRISDMPADYYLWHIGISKVIDIQKDVINPNELAGLFLMKSKFKGGDMKLYETRNDGNSLVWHTIREIEMPDEIKEIVSFPYKSCFIPGQDGAILLSFRDIKSRNRMIIINRKYNLSND